ncbi:MAG TPA: hypothetical protein PKE26_13960 [Kiritimatiellia bacterium]|nr:hypothetical protein [Kiritimatiellia bacterium]HMP00208.1 hypothetical protein [Kiritimatiellia bacterium]HMP96838.1 hypothetical protein [Kiritimatiellia bacterium]
MRTFILALNTIGLLGYLLWLVLGHQRILYTQAGVLFLLPCLPFFFVYFFLHRGSSVEHDHDPYE